MPKTLYIVYQLVHVDEERYNQRGGVADTERIVEAAAEGDRIECAVESHLRVDGSAESVIRVRLNYLLALPDLPLGLESKVGSMEPSFLRLTLQSNVLPVVLDLQPFKSTFFPSSRAAACFSVNVFPHHPSSLKPHPAVCFHVPSSCCSFLLEEQV